MNARQAAKAAAKKIEEMQHYNDKCKADIMAYNAVIQAMIEGKSPCPWCEEHEECQLTAKDVKGCDQWWLSFTPPEVKEETNDSEDVPVVGSEGRA